MHTGFSLFPEETGKKSGADRNALARNHCAAAGRIAKRDSLWIDPGVLSRDGHAFAAGPQQHVLARVADRPRGHDGLLNETAAPVQRYSQNRIPKLAERCSSESKMESNQIAAVSSCEQSPGFFLTPE
jgi:hypothetical protein